MCAREQHCIVATALMLSAALSCGGDDGRGKLESADLTISVEVATQTVNADQPLRVTFRVGDLGPSSVNITSVVPSASLVAAGGAAGSASCTPVTSPPPRSIAVGETTDFTCTCKGSVAGELTVTGTVAGTDARTHETVGAIPGRAAVVTVQTPARLEATLAIRDPPAPIVGRDLLTVMSTVTNRGTAAAHVNSVTPTVSSGQCTAVTMEPVSALPGLGSIDATWTCQVKGEGALTLRADVVATDDNSGEDLSAVAGPLGIEVQPALVATIYAVRTRVGVGQQIDYWYNLHNDADEVVCLTHFFASCGMDFGEYFVPNGLPLPPGGDFEFDGGVVRCSFSEPGVFHLWAVADGMWDTNDFVPGECVLGFSGDAIHVEKSVPIIIDSYVEIASVGLTAEPTTVAIGQSATLVLSVAKGGTGPALIVVTPTASPEGPDCGTEFQQTMEAPASYEFRWACTASLPGTYRYGATLLVSDLNVGPIPSPDPVEATVIVQ